MLDSKQFTSLVQMTLDAIGLGGNAAVHLIVGTALQESSLTYLMQNGGPAIGILEIEPFTYLDIRHRMMGHQVLEHHILGYLNMNDFPEDAKALMGNMTLSIIIARLKYYLLPEALPMDDPVALCEYYKKYYNTMKGKADVDKALHNFQLACNIN